MKLDPKKMFEPLIHLLGHRKTEVQKLSLFCIETYRAFIPYKKFKQMCTKKTSYKLELKEIFEDDKSHIDNKILSSMHTAVVSDKRAMSLMR